MEQTNAASPKQVKKMVSHDERLRQRELDDLRVVMSSVHGRRLMWRLMAHCRTYQSALHPSGSQVYYNIGQQDIGHFLQAEITAADDKKFYEMQLEAKGYEHV